MKPVLRSIPTAPTAVSGCLAAVVCATLAVPSPSVAQDDGDTGDFEPRRGFWLSGGLGAGINDEGNGGGAGYLRLGGSLAPNLLLGGDVVVLTRETTATVRRGDLITEDDADLTRSNVTASVLLYPSEQGDFFLKGGIGFSHVEASVDVDDATVSADDSGIGLTLGAGHDIRLGDGNLFLTPNLDILLQTFDDLDSTDALFLLTLGIGFR